MSELKTLKNLEVTAEIEIKIFGFKLNEKVIMSSMLRQEAIKWFKSKTYINDDYTNGRNDFIIDFFNIKEEELKEVNNE
jgi:hypothetical protein